jgi:hypothetical protein
MPTKTTKSSKKPTGNNSATKVAEGSVINIPAIIQQTKEQRISVTIESVTGYICHRFGAETKRKMLFGMMNPDKKSTASARDKPAKDPFNEFEEAGYWLTKKKGKKYEVTNLCCKAIAFKAAICDTAAEFSNKTTLTKKGFKRYVFVESDYTIQGEDMVVLENTEPLTEMQKSRADLDPLFADKLKPYHDIGISMHETEVAIGMNQKDLRYRPLLQNWQAELTITFERYPVDLIMAMLSGAGKGGVGENRPTSKMTTGPYGRFRIKTSKEV